MAANLHVGDIGTAIIMTVNNQDGIPIDLSSFTNLVLIIKRSDASIVERTCIFVTNGVDGKVQYISTINDFTILGNYKFQVRCSSGGNVWHSNILVNKVYPNVGN